MTPEEKKVFEALDDPNWDARTKRGLARATGLSEYTVTDILARYRDFVRAVKTADHGVVYRLIKRTRPIEESVLEKTLDYLSLGRRKRIA